LSLKVGRGCRSLLAGDCSAMATDQVPNRLQAGSYISITTAELSRRVEVRHVGKRGQRSACRQIRRRTPCSCAYRCR
jgi:hypothetical protein